MKICEWIEDTIIQNIIDILLTLVWCFLFMESQLLLDNCDEKSLFISEVHQELDFLHVLKSVGCSETTRLVVDIRFVLFS